MTSIKSHILKALREAHQYELVKMHEAQQSSNKLMQQYRKVRMLRMLEAGILVNQWQPTITTQE